MDEHAIARAIAEELDKAYAHHLGDTGDEYHLYLGRVEGLAQALSIVRGTHHSGELQAVRIRAKRIREP